MRTFEFLGPNIVSLGVVMSGMQQMDDGTNLGTWYFREGSGLGFNNDRTVPCPVIEAVEGQTVSVTLASNRPHTIHFHGLDVDQANDGVGPTSGYVAAVVPGDDFGRVNGYTRLVSPFTYTFTAPHAGTYMYHCHVDTVLHIERGMIGTVIVRPPDGSTDTVWNGGPTFDKEYVWHLHTFDSAWHSIQISDSNTVRHSPDYFLINGKDGNQIDADPASAIAAGAGDRVLIRATNVGYQPALVKLGGLAFDVVASDGRPLASTLAGVTEQWVAPGERYDLILTMPASANATAMVEYWDPRIANILGTATAPVVEDPTLFADGFETGNTSRWSNTVE
ncbi:MAG: multicopper oxidase domain-containing protein [Acidobacteriota bacterium]